MTNTWLNNDGLYIKFGTDEGHSISDGGQYNELGQTESVVLEILLKDLTETETIQNDVLCIPKGVKLTRFELDVVEGAVTGAGIDVGTIHVSRDPSDAAYTADPDSIAAAVLTANLTLGSTYSGVYAGSGPAESPAFGANGDWGAAIGTITTVPLLITASRTTSTAFTAGKLRLRVSFLPNAVASNEFALG